MREADGLKGKKMKVYDTKAPFSAFSPKFDALCYSMIERQDFFSLLA